MWHFHDGVALRIYVLEPDGMLDIFMLGTPLRHEGANFQTLVPASRWFAAECAEPVGYSLVGGTVAPGFRV